jgi:hypothetical protein
MAKFIITRDINGYPGAGLPFTTDNVKNELVADTPKSVTVPSINDSPLVAVFGIEPGSKIWVALNPSSTIAPPSAGEFVASEAQLNPLVRNVFAGDILQFVTSDTSAEISVSFYELKVQ